MTNLDRINRLADIIWFIKGMVFQAQISGEICMFDEDHIKALRKAMNLLRKEEENEKRIHNQG